MRIQFRDRDVVLTKVVRDHVERRLGLALGRFAGKIGSVKVRLSSEAGEKRCELDVGLRPQKVRAEDCRADLLAAVDAASDRLSSAVGRALEREAEWLERGPRVPAIVGSGSRAARRSRGPSVKSRGPSVKRR